MIFMRRRVRNGACRKPARGWFLIACQKLFVFLFLFSILLNFALAVLGWAFMLRRTEIYAVCTKTRPFPIKVDVGPTSGDYYRVWRYHDLDSDSYRSPRYSGFPAVPILYVHGNAGSFLDMRSLGRFIGESNVKQRRSSILDFEKNVKRVLFDFYIQNGWEFSGDEEDIPQHLVDSAEDIVISETPLLGAELFGVDFLEESNIHSGVLMVKEARFVNHTVHSLMTGLVDHYEQILSQAESSIRRKKGEILPLPNSAKAAEVDYINSICSGSAGGMKNEALACTNAKKHIRAFSSVERIRRELKRVQSEGIWVWSGSMGGVIALFATLLAPHMYAGLIMAGPPLRYLPFLFDSSCVDFERAVHDAAVVSYTNRSILTPAYNWSKVFTATKPVELLRNMREIPSSEIAARVRRVNLLIIHGGALDVIVPSHSSLLLRSVGRRASSADHQKSIQMTPLYSCRRDVSTEGLRDCGTALTHHQLVYTLQLVRVAADSLVRAALFPNATQLMGAESTLPLRRERLLPMVLETLLRAHDDRRVEEFLFVTSLVKKTGSGGYRKINTSRAMEKMKNICVDSASLLNLQEIPMEEEEEEEDVESWKPLQLFIGTTTYAPDEVHLPELRLMDAEEGAPSRYMGVYSRAATKLHLPTRRKDSKPTEGSVLRTVISFQVLQTTPAMVPRWVRPRFCFYVYREEVSERHSSYIIHDRIDPLREATTIADVGGTTVGSQMNGGISVKKFGRFALIRDLQSISMETNMVVQVRDREVFPHVICGSFRSFRLLFRGTEGLALDEPESQQQHFYGPYEEHRKTFHYSWRPFHTTPFNLTNAYVVYVLGADEQPAIHLVDLELYQSPSWGDFHYWIWRFRFWKVGFMAMLTTYSILSRYGGCYTLFYLTLYVSFRTPHFYGDKLLLKAPLRKLHNMNFLFICLVALVSEFLSTHLVRSMLTVCLQDDLPLRSDAELTSMMHLGEKLMLIFFFALPPSYEACKYSWIRMQTVTPGDVENEHLMHVLCSFLFGLLLLSTEFVVCNVLWSVLFVLRCFVGIRVSERPFLCCLGIAWCIPMILLLAVPCIHISITITLACLMSFAAIWFIPTSASVGGGPQYRWLCFLLTALLHFTAHFEGLVFVVRNCFFVSSVVMNDLERTEVLPEQLFVFAVVQYGLAVVYSTVYFTRLHDKGVAAAAAAKKNTESNEDAGEIREIKRVVETNYRSLYILGDVGRCHPRLMRAAKLVSQLMFIAAHWITLVAMRRPLEGSICSFGLCAIALHVAFVLVQLW